MKPYTLLAAAAALLALSACSNDAEKDAASISFEKADMQKSYCLLGTAADFDSESDLSFGCEADLLLPTALFGQDVAALRDSILAAAFDTCGENTTQLIEIALRKAAAESGYAVADTVLPDSIIRDEPSFLSRYDGFSSSVGTIGTITTQRLVYAVTNSIYMPRAAHGMYATRYINYDLESGRVISLRELFTAQGLRVLPSIIEEKARQMVKILGRTDIEELPAFDNYFLDNEGNIVFAYQPYEVASYAQGEIQIAIPAYKLSDILSPFGNDFLLNPR